MFSVEMLPAGNGDCLWIEYGRPDDPHRVLIDTGRLPTYRLLRDRLRGKPAADQRFDLMVVSHVDADHIEGVLPFLQDKELNTSFADVWFNGWDHLNDRLGGKQGDYLSGLLVDRRLAWNQAFNGRAIVLPEGGKLPKVTLDGGMNLTLLSPTRSKLQKLAPRWKKEVEKAFAPGDTDAALKDLRKTRRYQPDRLGKRPNPKLLAESPSKEDTAPPNGSSIAFIAEYEGKSCLFAADAHPALLADSIRRYLLEEAGGASRLSLDACKLPHHGSAGNVTRDLLELIRCERWLFSSDGKQFGHPDAEAVARVLTYRSHRPICYFNYRTAINAVWDDVALRKKEDYETRYLPHAVDGYRIQL